MISPAERRRLEEAYPDLVDVRPVLRRCAAGLLAVLAIAASAAIVTGGDEGLVPRVSASQAASDR
jgi:hypothetical protein